MQILRDPRLRLQTLLWLVAMHSFAVGLALIWHPAFILARSGYAAVTEPFFPTQGGVFHVIMAIGYGLAAKDPQNRRTLVEFSILVKVIALVFLVAYWLFVARNLVILLSGLGDGAMAAAIATAYMTWRRSDQPGA